MANNWSEQQIAIFNYFATGKGNLIVRARAGTGKTTTILEGIGKAPEASILLAAFNKSIAEELSSRIKSPAVEAKTLHGLGFTFLRRFWSGLKVDNKRGLTLSRQVCANAPDAIVTAVTKLHTKIREISPLCMNVNDALKIAQKYDCLPEGEWLKRFPAEEICRMALNAVDAAAQRTSMIDFADMLFLPIVHDMVSPMYDMVVIDEAQDMSDTQLTLAMQACKPEGRICVVGDDRQAIYGFRGADSGSLDRLKKELKADELGLTITYRCPTAVVAEAKHLVPDYTAAPEAPEGEITDMKRAKLITSAEEGDFVLSRSNAPLVSICIALLKAGTRARIKGRDIGASLLARLKGLRIHSLSDLGPAVSRWESEERKRVSGLEAELAAQKLEAVLDQCELFIALSEGLSTVAELESRITSLFVDDAESKAVMCSTVHRAKGLEAETVYLLDWTFKRPTTIPEEANIRYVALTRAKKTLCLVDDDK